MSYGQTLLRKYLSVIMGENPIENYRPDWLNGMELDLYFESIGLGVEFQGDQHSLPVYGWGSTIAQKGRDKAKRAICQQRGIYFMTVEAIDLEYTRLFRKLKKATGGLPGFRKFVARRSIRGRLREINKEAVAYRKTLSQNYGAPSAHRKGYKRKMKRYEWLKEHGFACSIPESPEQRRLRRAAKKAATKAHIESLAARGLAMIPASAPKPLPQA